MKILKIISKTLNALVGNKYVVLAVFVVFGLLYMPAYSCGRQSSNEELETYRRQISGQLTEKEKELQEANEHIDVMRSMLLTQEELAERVVRDAEELSGEFEKFRAKHNLQIRSRDKTIASLKQKISDGESKVDISGESAETCDIGEISKCPISYKWQDKFGRFKLVDDNIFDGKSEFFASQNFKIYGEIYEQKDGSLQTRRLVLREVYQKPDGTYEEIDGAKAKIVDSSFEYHNPPEVQTEWQFGDLFRLRGIAVGGAEILPNSGHLTVGLGLEFMNFYGAGLGTFISVDFQNLENIAAHLSLQYNPTILDTELNFGVFVSIGTPFVRFFNDYQFSAGLVFYLNN